MIKNQINIANESAYYENICSVIKTEAIKNIKNKGSFTFVISGGRSPKNIFNILATPKYSEIDWDSVLFFFVDERIVTIDSPENNFETANYYLFSKLKCKCKVFNISVDSEACKSVIDYETLIYANVNDYLNGLPSFDLVLLGMGEDGHIASIFPTVPPELYNKHVFSTELVYNDFVRISLGFPLINNAKRILLLVNSKSKLFILNKKDLMLPVHKINFLNTTIFTNEEGD